VPQNLELSLAKVRVKRQSTGKPSKRGFPWTWVIIALFTAAFVSIFVVNSQQVPSPIPEGARAAIVDQLYASYPNEEFTTKVTRELENYGFEVDLYQGDAVTVDLYRNLPGYSLVVFRAHSGPIGPTNPRGLNASIGTYLFTNEPYSQIKHPREQLNHEVNPAKVAEGYPLVFAIGPKFVTNRMNGNFHDTVLIVGGCACLYNEDLAQAFIARGASAYLAWNSTVEMDYVDEATISLVENLCSERLTVKKAVDLTMATKGADPKYHAALEYYPPQAGDKALKELVQ